MSGEQLSLFEDSRHRTRAFPLAFGRAIADEDAMALVRQVHKVRLPAGKWASVPKWSELKKREVERIRAEEGERAYADLRKTTSDRKLRGKLLKRRFRADGTETVQLTAEAERSLKVSVGLGSGYRQFDPKTGEEFFVRLFQVNKGHIEAGLSWWGLAGPWFKEWREEFRKQTAELHRQVSLEDLDEERLAKLDRLIRRAQILEDGQKIMEMILGQVSRQARNPIRIPAVAVKVLLGLEKDKNWKFRVEGGLSALKACSFKVTSFGMASVKAYGAFLGEWRYRGAGPGDHGDGEYDLYVMPGFIGCLSVFESGKRRLDSNIEVTTYDFGRKPTKEDRKALGWGGSRKNSKREESVPAFSGFDAGRPFYNAAEGFSLARCNLITLIEREITLRKDSAARGRKHARVPSKALDANEPRLYGHEFCPLLPKGKLFHGALGHFRRSPEAGRTLCGTRARPPGRGGPHQGSLVSIMGYDLSSDASLSRLRRVICEALEDIRAVVVDYLGGLLAARGPGGSWLSFEEVGKLAVLDLARRVKWFFFLPTTWREDRVRKWEARMKEKAARGETPYAWKGTSDPTKAAPAQGGETGSARVGLETMALRYRLRAARLDRGLTLADVGELFGVTKMSVSRWEYGPEPDEEGKVHGKPIPKSMAPLIERWVKTGRAPSPEELAARKNHRAANGEAR